MPIPLKELSERHMREVEETLLDRGVPSSLLALMRGRWEERRAVAELGRKLLPVETMPPGALPFYEGDLGIAPLVTETPEEEK